MKIKDLTDEQCEKIFAKNPSILAHYRPKWVAMFHPDYMIIHKPLWMFNNNEQHLMAEHNPEWVATKYPEKMVELHPEWMCENRSDYMYNKFPEIYKPYALNKDLPTEMVEILALD